MSTDDLHPDIHRRPITIRCSTCGSPYDEGHGVEDCLRTKDAEIERLMQWKAEASQVLVGWEQVWKAAGCPRPLGASKAEVVLAEIERLRAVISEAADDLAGSHFPDPGDDRMCVTCSGGWPCTASEVRADLRRALGDAT